MITVVNFMSNSYYSTNLEGLLLERSGVLGERARRLRDPVGFARIL